MGEVAKNPKAASTFTLGMVMSSVYVTPEVFDSYVDDLLAHGITNLRVDIKDYQDDAMITKSKAQVPRAIAKGAKVIWGVSSNSYSNAAYTITAANWPNFRAAILEAAAWAQANGVYEFQLGNEEELHTDTYQGTGTTMTADQLQSNLKEVATYIKKNSIYTRGNISYTTTAQWSLDKWHSLGRGDIDILAFNIYLNQYDSNDLGTNLYVNLAHDLAGAQKTMADAVSWWGADHTYITEFSLNYKSLNNYSTNEAIQATGLASMINAIKAAGITRADFYDYTGDGADEFGARKSDGTYRKIWDVLVASQPPSDTIPPTGGSIIYTGGDWTSSSVQLTVNDGTDAGSGIKTSSRIIQRKSATLSNGTCGTYGAWSTISPAGTYPNFTDTVSSGNCYQYQYLVSDNAGNQATYSPLDLGIDVFSTYDPAMFGTYLDDLQAAGITSIRMDVLDYNYPYETESKTRISEAVARGFKVAWGVSSDNTTITSASWPTFRQAIIDAATWAQANGVSEFYIGNEEELHVDGTTMTVDQIQANLKSLATQVQGIFTRGNVSYSTAGAYYVNGVSVMTKWHNIGRGDIDMLGWDVYADQGDYHTYLANIMSWWGNDHSYLTEFSINANGLQYYSTDEATQATAIASMIDGIKAAGITRANFFCYNHPDFGVRNLQNGGTYRQLLWNTLKSNVNTVKVTVSNPTGKIGDINNDGKVDILDLSTLLTKWGTSDTAADLNKNGSVDILDLSILLSKWGS